MVTERLARAVREQVGLGRLLPLGGPGDGVWLAESAATGVLRAAGDTVPGVRLDRLRIGPAEPDGESAGTPGPEAGAEPEGGGEPERGGGPAADDAVRPPSALPPGPLSVTGEFAAAPDAPLPERAAALRAVLADAAADRLGFRPAGIDLLVSGLLDEPPGGDEPRHEGGDRTADDERTGAAGGREPATANGTGDGTGTAGAVAAAVLAVPGVARLAPVLGGAPRGVRVTGGAVHLQLAVDAAAGPVLEVARAARRAAADAAGTDRVAVVVTAVG